MKRILLDKLDIILPPDVQRLCEGAEVYDSSCSTEARVYFIDRDGGFFLKTAAYGVLQDGKHALKNEVLIHGDYCLPNIMLDNWRFSGFIDLGLGGVGDRHVDLFWGAWTLGFNLGTDKYRERFFDAYGRDKVDRELLKVIAAAEVFR